MGKILVVMAVLLLAGCDEPNDRLVCSIDGGPDRVVATGRIGYPYKKDSWWVNDGTYMPHPGESCRIEASR